MTTDLEKFARRAVACKQWRWMPGMRTTEGWRVIRNLTESSCMAYDENPENWQVADNYFQDGAIPDLSDPATLGCLLALVRKAWGACVHIAPDTGWHVRRAVLPNGSTINLGIIADTEAAALVAALEAASCD